MSSDDVGVPWADEVSDDEDDDVLPTHEVKSTIPDAGVADIHLTGPAPDTVDAEVIPIRAPETPGDVTISFGHGGVSSSLSLSEDDALALIDAIQQALEVPPLDE